MAWATCRAVIPGSGMRTVGKFAVKFVDYSGLAANMHRADDLIVNRFRVLKDAGDRGRTCTLKTIKTDITYKAVILGPVARARLLQARGT